jgi:hypothetical protein
LACIDPGLVQSCFALGGIVAVLHVCQCFQVLLGVNRSTGSKVGKHQNGDAKHKHGGQFHFAAEVTTVSEKIQKLKIFTSI